MTLDKNANKKYKTRNLAKRVRFEMKKSNIPRVVWAEESKTGLEFEIGPSYTMFQ